MADLNEDEKNELIGGGECHLHFHPSSMTHFDIDRLQTELRVREVAANYTVSIVDDIVIANTNTGNITVTLPLAAGRKEFIITKSAAANQLIIAFSGGDTCFGQATLTVLNLGESRRLKAYNGDWITI